MANGQSCEYDARESSDEIGGHRVSSRVRIREFIWKSLPPRDGKVTGQNTVEEKSVNEIFNQVIAKNCPSDSSSWGSSLNPSHPRGNFLPRVAENHSNGSRAG